MPELPEPQDHPLAAILTEERSTAADAPRDDEQPAGGGAEPPAAKVSPADAEPADGEPAPAEGDDADDGEAETADDGRLPMLVEALLFVSDGPVEERTLVRALGAPRRRVDRAVEALAERLREAGAGVRLLRGPEGVQLVTAPEAAAEVETFLGLEASRRLSTAALETLAIVAYRQPVTRAGIESVRGVSSEGAVATLRARGLITEIGRADAPGRPVLFGTTQRFLEHFGLESVKQLPALPDDIDLPSEEVGAQLPLVPEEEPAGESPEATSDAGEPGDAAAGDPDDGVVLPVSLDALTEAAGAMLAPGEDEVAGAPDAGEDESPGPSRW